MPPLEYSIASDTASAFIGSSWQTGTSGGSGEWVQVNVHKDP